MRDVTVLQVGDLHFDDLRNTAPDVDVKDPGFPGHLTEVIAAHPLQAVMKPMLERWEDADVVMFCGDLTSYGDLDVYRDAVTYLNLNFWLEGEPEHALHAVVGNHDVDRRLVEPGGGDPMAKFEPLVAAWREEAVPILAAGLRHTEFVVDDVGLDLFSLNSCIGCGEFRGQALDDALAAKLELARAAGDKSARDSLFEQLDSPMFLDDDITDVAARIRELDMARVPVVLGHHNVLPQVQPRLQVYTEMVNAGAARSRLASCGRSVLYLHGHIHDDPVEVIEQLHPRRGRLVAISAPQLADGFNVIRISFGQQFAPLGATITPWRYRAGDVGPEAPIRVSLLRSGEETHEATSEVLDVMASGKHLRYRAFLRTFRDTHGPGRTEEEIQDALVEAEWAGLLTIDDRDEPATRWTLRTPLL